MTVRPLAEPDRAEVSNLITAHFGSTRIVSRGVVHEAMKLPGLVAMDDGQLAGLLLYDVRGSACEVVALVAKLAGHGIGRSLLKAMSPVAKAAGCHRLWLVTTNENQGAMAFYRACGWRQVAIHRGAVQEARRLKPEIPERGPDGTPIEDEIEFEQVLNT